MNAWKPLLFALAILAATSSQSEGASPCQGEVKGSWAFGRAPVACDPVHASLKTLKQYQPLYFHLSAPAYQETSRYMQDMFSFLRDAADYYLDQRREEPGEAERDAFRLAVMALAHQESYWSHYRLSDEDGLKIMRGDHHWGHGLFQIDERWHPKISLTAKGEILASHLLYGLDNFFKSWEKAAKADCVEEGDFEQRTRAAYSAYNGGPASICRWTNPKHKWNRNDRNFLSKLEKKEWLRFVSDAKRESPIDVECVMEGRSGCSARGLETTEHYLELGAAGDADQLAPAFLRPARTRNFFA